MADVIGTEEELVRRRLRAVLSVGADGPPAPDGAPGPTPRAAAPQVPAPFREPSGDLVPPHRPTPEVPAGARLTGAGAFDPGRRGVKALAAVAAVVVLIAGFLAWRARPAAERLPDPPVSATKPDGRRAADPASSPDAAGQPAEVVVTVAGRVRRPGLVRLPAGARLADALQSAGGAEDGVDVALLNPARKLTDGELVLVGVTPPPGADAAPAGPATGRRVSLNTASLAQLDALPGVGQVLAQRIIDHRTRRGPFRSVSDLRTVDGIGESRYQDLKDLVTV